MKKIINKPEDVVHEMCRGFVRAHKGLVFDERYKLIKKAVIRNDKVALISGGGSGHEPAHAGFVGEGMIDCAVCGDVFASPSQIQVLNAIKQCASSRGVLLVVKNYSGDCLNFNNAAERARNEGIDVDLIYVNDDIAVQDSLYTVGRRGVAGTIWVHKVVGAAAARGMDLADVKRLGEKVISRVRSFGFALSSCTPPAKGTPIFEIADDEMEFGVGIHGEPGRTTEKIQNADTLAQRIVEDLVTDLSLQDGEKVALIVNGFGATPGMELYVLNESVSRELEQRGLGIHRTLVGDFMTSLDMAGASVSVLKLDAELEDLIDAAVSTPALSWGVTEGSTGTSASSIQGDGVQAASEPVNRQEYSIEGRATIGETVNLPAMAALIQKMSDIIMAHEQEFCDMDQMGDGDFGSSIAKGFRELEKNWPYLKKDDIGVLLTGCSEIIEEYCGGASGPIWGSAFYHAGQAARGKKELNLADLAHVVQAANTGVYETGRKSFGKGAVVGDKTLVDALKPCADSLDESARAGEPMPVALKKAADAAEAGAESTRTVSATLGRAANLGDKTLGHVDAGAYGLAVIFQGLAEYCVSLQDNSG